MDDDRTLGGDGALNLPYEDVPDDPPVYGPENRPNVSAGLVILAAVLPHPLSRESHPALVFRFFAPDGTAYTDHLLVVENRELTALRQLLADAIEGARRGARRRAG